MFRFDILRKSSFWRKNDCLWSSYRPTTTPQQPKLQVDSPKVKRNTMIQGESEASTGPPKPKRASTGSIHLPTVSHCDQIVVHAGAVLSVFHLLPAIEYETDTKVIPSSMCIDLLFMVKIIHCNYSWLYKSKPIYNWILETQMSKLENYQQLQLASPSPFSVAIIKFKLPRSPWNSIILCLSL